MTSIPTTTGHVKPLMSTAACIEPLVDGNPCLLPALPDEPRCPVHAGSVLARLPLCPEIAALGRAAAWFLSLPGEATALAEGILLGLMLANAEAGRQARAAWTLDLLADDLPAFQRWWAAHAMTRWPHIARAYLEHQRTQALAADNQDTGHDDTPCAAGA